MFGRIQQLLKERGIFLSAPISLSDCTVTKTYLLERESIPKDGSAVIFAIPYHSSECENPLRNVSRYAVGQDYHLFAKQLSCELLPILQTEFPQNRFALFADHSPIDEREAAARSGLGMIGQHGLLITELYSSYVFLAELVTDCPLPDHLKTENIVQRCEGCGACFSACPLAKGEAELCLSALTQKKGDLTEEEADIIQRHRTVWGCDLCQEVCPHTRSAIRKGSITSPIPFFHQHLLPTLTYKGVMSMTDQQFSSRAYAWRGRTVILRNLAVVKEQDDKDPSKNQA